MKLPTSRPAHLPLLKMQQCSKPWPHSSYGYFFMSMIKSPPKMFCSSNSRGFGYIFYTYIFWRQTKWTATLPLVFQYPTHRSCIHLPLSSITASQLWAPVDVYPPYGILIHNPAPRCRMLCLCGLTGRSSLLTDQIRSVNGSLNHVYCRVLAVNSLQAANWS